MDPQRVHILAADDIPRWACVTASGELANSGNPAHEDHIIGVTEGKMAATDWGDVTVLGTIYNQDWAWTAGSIIYLNGTVLSETPPGGGFTQQIGWALTGQMIFVNPK